MAQIHQATGWSARGRRSITADLRSDRGSATWTAARPPPADDQRGAAHEDHEPDREQRADRWPADGGRCRRPARSMAAEPFGRRGDRRPTRRANALGIGADGEAGDGDPVDADAAGEMAGVSLPSADVGVVGPGVAGFGVAAAGVAGLGVAGLGVGGVGGRWLGCRGRGGGRRRSDPRWRGGARGAVVRERPAIDAADRRSSASCRPRCWSPRCRRARRASTTSRPMPAAC